MGRRGGIFQDTQTLPEIRAESGLSLCQEVARPPRNLATHPTSPYRQTSGGWRGADSCITSGKLLQVSKRHLWAWLRCVIRPSPHPGGLWLSLPRQPAFLGEGTHHACQPH